MKRPSLPRPQQAAAVPPAASGARMGRPPGRREARSSSGLGLSGGCRILLAAATAVLLGGCLGPMPQPLGALDRRLEGLGSSRSPALAGRWLALIAGRGGREQVQLIDLERQLPVPLPGLNRPDAQPLAVAVDASGDRLALVRQLEGRTELVLYRRGLISAEVIPMQPPGVPQRLSLRADGRELALEVSRGGLWQVDLIAVP